MLLFPLNLDLKLNEKDFPLTRQSERILFPKWYGSTSLGSNNDSESERSESIQFLHETEFHRPISMASTNFPTVQISLINYLGRAETTTLWF
jgi:hypothetical protein